MSDCLFCKIVAGKIPSDKVLENDHVLAFRDINPQAPVHILVIPKKHYDSVTEFTAADETLAGRLVLAAQQIAIQEKIADRGYRMVMNAGNEGGQSVAHVHLHLLGGRQMGWPPG